MKRTVLISLLAVIYLQAYSISDRIKLGLVVSPGISWMKPTGNDIHNGVAGFGLQYGLKVECYFDRGNNYAICTGLFGGIDGGGLHGRDTFTSLTHGTMVLERYSANYLNLPLTLKLKTNPIRRKYIIFGEAGVAMVFNISCRANYNTAIPAPSAGGALVTIDKENVLRNGNEVQALIPDFHYNIFDVRLTVGGGLEYRIGEKTSVFFAIHYNNGFINTIDDKSVNPKKDPTLVRNVLFSLGAMF